MSNTTNGYQEDRIKTLEDRIVYLEEEIRKLIHIVGLINDQSNPFKNGGVAFT